ncbi:hypothetical protein SBRCBS47491_007413 [Sporothrix bragantina]|uniref:Uncharacterized protein n=1 Tax=Sporothrix bragantina TaxID=671064 RepID=A0ABP0CET5_9PEZI
MFSTGQKLLHRARSLRRLNSHSHSQCSDDESMPPMPASPTSPTFSSTTAAPMAIPMPMPPTTRPRTGISTHHNNRNMTSTSTHDDEHVHFRQASTCSHASRASSSWSSNASTTSSTTSSRNAGLEWDSLRLHPVPSMPVVRASPQYYDADRSFYYHDDDSYVVSSSTHGFDFGFDRSAAAASSKRAVRQTIADIRLASSTDDDEGFEAQGLSAPPPSHHRLRAHQSADNLEFQQTMRDLQLLGASGILDRPSTPPMPALPASEPPSPVTPRTQPHAANETERYLKRGDWKRRGIVFSAFDD